MRKDKIKAYELRRQEKSYSEISRSLNIPKSTLAVWFKSQDWSQDIRRRLGQEQSFSNPKRTAAIRKANKERWSKIHQSYRDTAEKEFKTYKDHPLFLAALMLYWGEGDKHTIGPNSGQVKLANTDPAMLRIFYLFLKNVLNISMEKISVWLLLYPDLADEMQKNFWSKATGIPLGRFKNSIYIKGKHPTKRLSYGVCNIYVHSRELKEKLMVWLELSQRMLLS
jgi:hypothetical protein